MFADAVAMHEPEESSKEEVVPELWNCSPRVVQSECTTVH